MLYGEGTVSRCLSLQKLDAEYRGSNTCGEMDDLREDTITYLVDLELPFLSIQKDSSVFAFQEGWFWSLLSKYWEGCRWGKNEPSKLRS